MDMVGQRIVVVLDHAGLEQMQQHLGILRIVLVPGVMHRFPCSSYGQRRDKLQFKALGLQEMRQRTMVIASSFKNDTDRMSESVQVIGKAAELDGVVEQDKSLTALSSGCFDQDFVTRLGNVDGYQNSRLLRTLKNGHGWFAP